MIMNRIKLLMLLLQAIEVLSSSKYPTDCGYFPTSIFKLIAGGYKINPEKFSWMASLTYGLGNSFGICGGSVINSRYVLTAAHCVSGGKVKDYGELSGVRLGDFTGNSYCDYGTRSCQSYLHFGITEKIPHENYNEFSNDNDIALLRLDRNIEFNNILKPVCMPNNNVPQPIENTMLTVSGWGRSYEPQEVIAKRAVRIPLKTDPESCHNRHASRMCAGEASNNLDNAQEPCDGDSGGPIMQQHPRQTMVIEGIVSFVQEGCVNGFFTTHYTRVRYYLPWIHQKMYM